MDALLKELILIGLAIGAMIAIGKAALGVYRMAKRIESTFNLVDKELRPNGGSSLHDSIKRIDRRVEVLETMDRRDHHLQCRADDPEPAPGPGAAQ